LILLRLHQPSHQDHWEYESFRGDSRNPGNQALYSTHASKAPQSQPGKNPCYIGAAFFPSPLSSKHIAKKPTPHPKPENPSNANTNSVFLGTFSMVMTDANADMAPIHHRMPLIVHQEELPLWFGPDYQQLTDRSEIRLEARPA